MVARSDPSPPTNCNNSDSAPARPFLPLNDENPLSLHSNGALNTLIRSRSNASLHPAKSFSSVMGDELPDDEEAAPRRQWPHYLRQGDDVQHERRASRVFYGRQMRSMRLIGNSNPRYNWRRYWKTDEELSKMDKRMRKYYERTNLLIQQYIYIDRLLDSSIPHNLLSEYSIAHGYTSSGEEASSQTGANGNANGNANESSAKKIRRTPRNIYRVPEEETPLLDELENDDDMPKPEIPAMIDDSVESYDRVVQVAIHINLAANVFLLAGKIVVTVLTSSLSVLASLVDAALDLLSTAIVWTTTRMIAREDQYQYPVGRRRLEPLGILIFSVVMVTCFVQVAVQCFSRLTSGDHSVIQLGTPSLLIMASTVIVKALCWLWCRLVKNSSVQALAQDAMTDVVFNIFSIIFPLVGYYANLWWLDSLGGLLLSLFVIVNWAHTSAGHIRNLAGAAASADERNVLLYLTMRFAHTIKQIQGLQAYHAGDKLVVEVDIVLDETMSLRDSHDLGESLQYVLESVPTVDRAFVHQDYASWNLPSHLQQQAV